MIAKSKDVAKILELLSPMNTEDKVRLLEYLKSVKEKEKDPETLLKAVVLSRYPSIGAFAKAIGWTENKAYKTIHHERSATQTDMIQFIDHFGLPPAALTPLFFWRNVQLMEDARRKQKMHLTL